MATEGVVVAGLGITTAVGLSARECAASVRAGIMRFQKIPWLDRRFAPFTVAEVPDDALPEVPGDDSLTAREARLLRLAARPLAECLAALPPPERPGLTLSLPELETARPLRPDVVLRRLCEGTGGRLDPAASSASWRGRAGGLSAIGEAVTAILKGRVTFAVAGGVDSLRDLHLLGTLDLEGRVKSATSLDGFIPGEGAAFVLLASAKEAALRKLPLLGALSPVASGFEAGHLYSEEPYLGDGLSATLTTLLRGAPNVGRSPSLAGAPQKVREVYSSMNGESHWAKEWGVAFLRNHDAFEPDHRIHHPADCYGEIGAACGPALLGLAVSGLAGGYRRGPCLVYAASDRGARAALTVQAAA